MQTKKIRSFDVGNDCLRNLTQLFDSNFVMNEPTTQESCYEDWQKRRKELSTSTSWLAQWTDLRIKIFDYLIRRYRDSDAARKPANIPLGTNLSWDDRRITVHHHLGRRQVAGVHTKLEAETRVARIVRRLVSDERSDDALFRPTDVPDRPRIPLRWWSSILKGIRRGQNVDELIGSERHECSLLPAEAVHHLASRITDVSTVDMVAVDLLLKCENKEALGYCLRAWRERVDHGLPADEVVASLETRFRDSDVRERAAEFMRELLADESAAVRMDAIRLLAELGNLDDIDLLSELLALPDSEDDERHVIVEAMESISGLTG